MDWIDELQRAWAREYPDLDVSSLPPMVRAARLMILIEDFQAMVLEPFELSAGDYGVLAALRRAGEPYQLSPSKLYGRLQRSSGGMTKTLKKLEEAGLVARTPDPADGRGSLVHLTPEGIEVQDRVFHSFLSATQARLAPIGATRLEEVDDALRTLVEQLENVS
jgi:DNA-binding MarR family transcriptional regulator